MINQAQVDEVYLQLRKLQQEKENYEDCCNPFKTEMEEEMEDLNERFQAFSYQQGECNEMGDKKLLDIIEHNKECLLKERDIHGNLLNTIDTEAKSYYYAYECKEDDLQRQLQRLGVV